MVRYHKTKKSAKKYFKKITPETYGTPGKKITKRIWKTKSGYSTQVKLKMRKH